jgi:hypothetical protein
VHRAYVLPCLTPMHAYRRLPGSPHPNCQLCVACGQVSNTDALSLCLRASLTCVLVVSANVLDMPKSNPSPINTSLRNCLNSGPPPPKRPSAHAAAASPADSDDELPRPRFTYHHALGSCDSDDEVLIPRHRLSCLPSTSLPSVRLRPVRQAAGLGLLSVISICFFFVDMCERFNSQDG